MVSQPPHQIVTNPPFYRRAVPAAPWQDLDVSFDHLQSDSYRRKFTAPASAQMMVFRPASTRAPRELTPKKLDKLRMLTRDVPELDRVVAVGKSGACKLSLSIRSNDVVLLILDRVEK